MGSGVVRSKGSQIDGDGRWFDFGGWTHSAIYRSSNIEITLETHTILLTSVTPVKNHISFSFPFSSLILVLRFFNTPDSLLSQGLCTCSCLCHDLHVAEQALLVRSPHSSIVSWPLRSPDLNKTPTYPTSFFPITCIYLLHSECFLSEIIRFICFLIYFQLPLTRT